MVSWLLQIPLSEISALPVSLPESVAGAASSAVRIENRPARNAGA